MDVHPVVFACGSAAIGIRVPTNAFHGLKEGDEAFFFCSSIMDPRDLLDADCVVKITDGPVSLARIKKSDDKSFSVQLPDKNNIEIKEIEWAAPVAWVRKIT